MGDNVLFQQSHRDWSSKPFSRVGPVSLLGITILVVIVLVLIAAAETVISRRGRFLWEESQKWWMLVLDVYHPRACVWCSQSGRSEIRTHEHRFLARLRDATLHSTLRRFRQLGHPIPDYTGKLIKYLQCGGCEASYLTVSCSYYPPSVRVIQIGLFIDRSYVAVSQSDRKFTTAVSQCVWITIVLTQLCEAGPWNTADPRKIASTQMANHID